MFAETAQGRDIARRDCEDLIELEVYVFGKRIPLEVEEFLVEHHNCRVIAKDSHNSTIELVD